MEKTLNTSLITLYFTTKQQRRAQQTRQSGKRGGATGRYAAGPVRESRLLGVVT